MIDLVAELVWQPTFPEDEWARVHAQTLASLKADRDRVESLAYKALLRHLYPPSSPFHAPLGGTLDSVTPLTRDAARHFHARHYSPARVAWIVSGDFERSEILDLIEAASDRPDIWNPSHAEGTRPDPLDGPPRSLRVALAHRAGSVQAMLRAGQVGLPRAHPDHEALALWNQILGGQFSSRLNEVLREQKGYTYGIRSHLDGRRAAGPFWIGAALEAERLADALRDLIHEIEVLLDARPPTQNEIDDAVRALVEGQARQFETPGELVSKFGQLFVHNLPPDHHAVLADRLARIQRDELHACAKRHIDPRAFVIAIAGDADRITPQIESRGWDAEIVRD